MTTTLRPASSQERDATPLLSIEYTTVDEETLARVMSAARSASARAVKKHEREFSPIARKPFSLLK